MNRIHLPWSAVVIVGFTWILSSCGPASSGGARPPRSTPSAWKKVDPEFPRREAAVYRGLAGEALYCTLLTNRPAGARWLEVVTEKKANGLDPEDLQSAVQGALSSVEAMNESELADVGWLVALRLQEAGGGEFVWDDTDKEVALTLPSGVKLHPMRIIAEAFEGRASLSDLRPGSGQGPRIDCKKVGARDVLRQRALLSGERRR